MGISAKSTDISNYLCGGFQIKNLYYGNGRTFNGNPLPAVPILFGSKGQNKPSCPITIRVSDNEKLFGADSSRSAITISKEDLLRGIALM